MAHVFLSYSHEDGEYAARLAARMREEGIDTWLDSGIDYGARWSESIEEHLKESAAVVVVMSVNSKKSEWVKNEIHYARRKGIPLFPLLLSGEVWLEFAATQYADVRTGQMPPEDFFEALQAASTQQGQTENIPSVADEFVKRQETPVRLFTHPSGRFEQHGDLWVEFPPFAPGKHFKFKEFRRDDDYIYLYDETRRSDENRVMYLRLPLEGGMAEWTYPNPTIWKELYPVEPGEVGGSAPTATP